MIKMVDRNDRTTIMPQAQLLQQVRPGRGEDRPVPVTHLRHIYACRPVWWSDVAGAGA